MARWLPGLRGPAPLEVKGAAERRMTSVRGGGTPGQPWERGDWWVDKAISEGFHVNPWIYRCVHKKASAALKHPIVVRYQDPDEGEIIPIKRDPTGLTRRFNIQANPWERGKMFRYRLWCQRLLSPRGVFIEVTRSYSGGVAMLDLWEPDLTEIIPAANFDRGSPGAELATGQTPGLPPGWADPIHSFRLQLSSGGYDTLPRYDPEADALSQPRSILWLRSPHPTMLHRGVAPITAAALSADLDQHARIYNRRYLENDGRPGGLVMLKGSVTPETMDAIRTRFESQQRAGRTMVVNGDSMEYVDLSTHPRDAQWENTRKATKEEILMCLAGDTGIVTRHGVVPIAEVTAGMEVMTHQGRWRRVTQKIDNPVHHRTLRVQAKGMAPLTITDNHPVYAARYEQDRQHRHTFVEHDWVQAGSLRPRARNRRGGTDAMTVPGYRFTGDGILRVGEHVELGRRGNFTATDNGDWVAMNSPRVQPLASTLKMTHEMGYVVGAYLAEGHIENRHKVCFSYHRDEVHLHEQVIAGLRDGFGVDPSRIKQVDLSTRTPGHQGWMIQVSNVFLAQLLTCGTARTKALPAWAWDGPREFADGLLTGWMDGDGKTNTANGNGQRCVGFTASQTLAWQLRLIAIGLGHATSLVPRQMVHNAGWELSYSLAPQRAGSYRIEDGQLSATITGVTPVPAPERVYNLEVEEDQSYLTTSGVVHNCFGVPESVAGNASGRTFDNADAEWGIFWEDMEEDISSVDDQVDILTGGYDDDLFARHDLTDNWFLNRHRREAQDREQAAFDAGTSTINDVRKARGQEPLDTPAARALWIPAGKVPVADPAHPGDQEELAKLMPVGTPATDPGAAAQAGAEQGSQLGARVAGNINAARSLQLLAGKAAGAGELEGKQGGGRPAGQLGDGRQPDPAVGTDALDADELAEWHALGGGGGGIVLRPRTPGWR